MVTIEVYNNKDGKKIQVFDRTDAPTYLGEIFNIEYNDRETEFSVIWCSVPKNGYQKAIVKQI